MRFIATGGVLKGILKPEDEITTEEMISSSEEVQDVGEGRVAFNSNLNTANTFMRQNITSMQTNLFPEEYLLTTFSFHSKSGRCVRGSTP